MGVFVNGHQRSGISVAVARITGPAEGRHGQDVLYSDAGMESNIS